MCTMMLHSTSDIAIEMRGARTSWPFGRMWILTEEVLLPLDLFGHRHFKAELMSMHVGWIVIALDQP